MVQKSGPSRMTKGAGTCVAVGATLGLLFGLMLLEGVVVGLIAGAVIGALAGMIWALQSKREQAG